MELVVSEPIFADYSFSEFIGEFFRTLVEVLTAIVYAFWQLFHDIGPLKFIIIVYIFVLLLAVVSELKKNQRKREADQRAFTVALEQRRAEERRRMEQRQERINEYKQREAKRGTTRLLPPGMKPTGPGSGTSQHSRPGVRGH
jgi:hypothetical protein